MSKYTLIYNINKLATILKVASSLLLVGRADNLTLSPSDDLN